MQPKISVITPVYNVGKYLTETVNLILNQTFSDFELIIIDDKSTDNTWEIAQNLAKNDNRIRTIKLPEHIIGYIRNYGISEAKGDYIMFIDGDDIPDKTLLEKMYKSVTENNSDIAMCNFRTIDNVNRKISDTHVFGQFNECKQLPKVFNFTDIKNQIFTIPNIVWNKIYRKDFLIENNIKFPEDIILCEDIVFSVLCTIKANRLSLVDENLLLYRINRSDSASECKDKTFFDIFRHYEFLRKNFENDNIYDVIKIPFILDIIYTLIYYLSKIKIQYKFSFYNKMREFLSKYNEEEFTEEEKIKQYDISTYFYIQRITQSSYLKFVILSLTDKIIQIQQWNGERLITLFSKFEFYQKLL